MLAIPISTGQRHRVVPIIRLQVFVFFLGAVIIFSRRPDSLLNPQFWAEDGAIWYAEAYNSGWFKALFVPYAGYFEVLPRLIGAVALLAPLHLAPLLMNVMGASLQIVPANFLVSRRCINWGALPLRASFAAMYLLLPNTNEIHITATNAQWHLALLAALVVFSEPPLTRIGRALDAMVIWISGLTGPFCIMLTRLGWFRYFEEKKNYHRALAIWLLCLSFVQTVPIICSSRTLRNAKPLGASMVTLLRLLAGHITAGLLFGANTFARSMPFIAIIFFVMIGGTITLYCLRSAALPIKCILVFSGLLMAVALKSPLVVGSPSWVILEGLPGCRYWFFPTLAFGWAIIWCWFIGRSRSVRIMAAFALTTTCIGLARDFQFPALPDVNFQEAARSFELAKSGTSVLIPIYPRFCDVRLVKQ